ncbi:MAG: SoxR reducing system RseC family protein [Bacteroidaceae bacterium]|nr:SoxR reducing system RseC family protein [Bacteroidaceae bacterium]
MDKRMENSGCQGCKISMFCSNRGNEEGCETNLKAAGLAFVIPLIGIVAILAVGDIYMEESVTALLILIFLVIYFVLIKLCNPRF